VIRTVGNHVTDLTNLSCPRLSRALPLKARSAGKKSSHETWRVGIARPDFAHLTRRAT
jgi:hypothetical protein